MLRVENVIIVILPSLEFLLILPSLEILCIK
jgi:hypothetical protein